MKKFKTSTELRSAANLAGERKAVELIAKAGFDGWDFSLYEICNYSKKWGVRDSGHPLASSNYLAFARELKNIGLDNGIVCNQSHAPTPSYAAPVRSLLKRAIECTAEAGGEVCVIHPGNDYTLEQNRDMYLELLPFAKECGVKLATENMWNWDKEKDEACPAACSTPESFCAHMTAIEDPFFVACLDIGHAEMRGHNTNAVEMIHALGSRIGALHLHDNDQWKDSHQIPGSMSIDFAAVMQALKEEGYNGWITLEAYNYLKDFTPDTVFEGLQNLSAAARRLADRME
ncbi:MAG: sugar phosphate isomerase/epimerase [Oscillospiraceae bacterium]|nr:sugar phosphate isomerase/epimerase [Oscillospiraceae bacterium]